MGFLGMVAIGIALAMDVAAVSMANGMIDRRIRFKDALWMSGSFGLFQGLFAGIGWLAGSLFFEFITGIDHWIALGLLSFLGGKMLVEALRKDTLPVACELSKRRVLTQSVATSIDALAVGVSLVVLEVDIVEAAVVIGLCSFAIGLLSIYIGKRFGAVCKNKSELIGAIILIVIGINIFVTHVVQ
jgi:manganese efflux pump family protein